ncbi:MAG: spermidine/putrescine ABC transporter permease PotC, partial [Thermomicrobiales bacterium]|nr:spermidine/putrescine ABC transporter permease PotC [Thermomicrobiales bacterium]
MASRRRMPVRWGGIALGGVSVLIYAFLYLPIVVVVLYSFNATRINVWPIERYSLDWYRELRGDQEIRSAIWMSVRVGLVASG